MSMNWIFRKIFDMKISESIEIKLMDSLFIWQYLYLNFKMCIFKWIIKFIIDIIMMKILLLQYVAPIEVTNCEKCKGDTVTFVYSSLCHKKSKWSWKKIMMRYLLLSYYTLLCLIWYRPKLFLKQLYLGRRLGL